MAIKVLELSAWLAQLDDHELVAIDDGGLILQTINEPVEYIEIGGVPE